MKKTIPKEITICDKCGEEAQHPLACMNCGTELCFACQEKHGKRYPHAFYFVGYGDGFYCKPCDKKLTSSGEDDVHNAYRVIASLRKEAEAWSVGFKKRQDAAENTVKKLSR